MILGCRFGVGLVVGVFVLFWLCFLRLFTLDFGLWLAFGFAFDDWFCHWYFWGCFGLGLVVLIWCVCDLGLSDLCDWLFIG